MAGMENTPKTITKAIAELAILVVEDHPLQQKLLVNQLLQAGCRAIKIASDGAEALEVMAQNPADLVFCDIHMPNMNGLQFVLAQGELARAAGQPLPMLVWMSSQEQQVLDAHALLAHAEGYRAVQAYPKPLTSCTVQQVLRRAISSGGGATP